MCNYFVDVEAASNKENVDPYPVEIDDWLHRNDSYQTHDNVNENLLTRLPCNILDLSYI
jgi:hypothetical protein